MERQDTTNEKVVLVVDDEKAILVLLRVALTPGRFRVIVAPNGAEALAAAQQAAPDLLITDVSMPGLTGYELARRLRADHREMKVLYISGYPINDEKESEFVDDSAYLQKPFRLEALMTAVESLLDANPMTAALEAGRSAAAAAA
jgi:CheY-like chemotaxis protein